MKTFIFILLLSFHSLGVTWSDLETSELKLTQDIQLKLTERSGSLLDIPTGEKFTVKEITALNMIQVTLFEMNYKNCSGMDLKTEMEIIAVKKTGVEIGALIEKNCILEIYVENKDLMTESFFE